MKKLNDVEALKAVLGIKQMDGVISGVPEKASGLMSVFQSKSKVGKDVLKSLTPEELAEFNKLTGRIKKKDK